jgi:hypothetical protein
VSSRKLADEFQDVNPVHSFQRFVAAMALKPAKKLASIAQILGTTRRDEAAYVAQVLIVVAKNIVEGITGTGTDYPSQHSLITKMLPQVMHYHRSVLENSVGGEFLFDELLYQALIDLFSGFDTDRSSKVVEPACQAKNALSTFLRETKPV